MKRLPMLGLVLILLFTIAGLATSSPVLASSLKTYTILVGAENVSNGIGIMAYFPDTLKIHVGDKVVWQANTHEIHTVTFLDNQPVPDLLIPTAGIVPPLPGPLMINPQVAFPSPASGSNYNGSGYANSGILSTDPGQATQYSLTFTTQGSFMFMCVVHGMMMMGTIDVVPASVSVASPAAVSKQAANTITRQVAQARVYNGVALSQVPPARHNADGTTAHTVLIGWSQGQVDLMSFFPKKLVVHPGDTVTFMLSATNAAPHTVTFLNGAPDISFVNFVPPSYLLLNPEILGPINAGQPLTHTGIFSSGLLDSTTGGPTSYTFTIGNITGKLEYECLLHDTSGMQGLLQVEPRDK